MKVKVIGWIDLDKPELSVSRGAKEYLRKQKREAHMRKVINKMWGGLINNK